MTPEDLGTLVWASDPRVSPDGGHVAYVVTTIDLEENRYRSRIWVAAVDGSTPPRALTAGEYRDSDPRWAPDGRAIAFTSKRPTDVHGESRCTLHLLPFGVAGETVLLAEGPEGFAGLTFSPDGTRLAYTTRVRAAGYDESDPRRRPPRRIDDLLFMLNGEGFIIDRPAQLHVLPLDGSGAPRNLTPAHREVAAPSWFPDGDRLAVESKAAGVSFSTDIAVVDLDGDVRIVTDGTGMYHAPSVGPDGDTIAMLGHDDSGTLFQNSHVGLLDSDATDARPRWISTEVDRTWRSYVNGQAPIWLDADRLLGNIEDRGNIAIRTIARHDGATAEVVGGDRMITGWSIATEAGDDSPLAFSASDPLMPAEIHVRVGGVERRLTSVTSAHTGRTSPRAPEHFLATSGDVEVDAWIITPTDFDPGGRYPMLLNIHGGPFTQYGNVYFDEFQMQAAAGYVVVYANPRGGSGRDADWSAAIRGQTHPRPGSGWGSVDFDDLMAVVDTALERNPFIDPDRLGVLGGSYGGYMTTWIVAHDHRFRAACSERSANNLLTLEHGSDLAGFFSAEIGSTHIDRPDEYARMSPTSYVTQIDTPLMIIHSEDDLRCPVDQAHQLFVALTLLGKEVEYHLFPDEDHELSRSGSPIHRRQRAELILEFFDRHLKG